MLFFKAQPPFKTQKMWTCTLALLGWLMLLAWTAKTVAGTDIGEDIRNGNGPSKCIHFIEITATFNMSCSIAWNEVDEFIELRKGEVFDGQDFEIHLEGIADWKGMFEVDENGGIGSLAEGPVIRNLHFKGGTTAIEGGFVMRSSASYFTIHSCSSDGNIAEKGGGICGSKCSGEILIANCSSTGLIIGDTAGGIVGYKFGHLNGHGNITHCFSTGQIEGEGSGGIAGSLAGFDNGEVRISECYTNGSIRGNNAGGLVGSFAGGGSNQEDIGGLVEISNSYSRGDILAAEGAGGIAGDAPGRDKGVVNIHDVYASGFVPTDENAGIISRFHPTRNFRSVKIIRSVCNSPVVRDTSGQLFQNTGTVADLDLIQGKLFCVNLNNCWDSSVWTAVEQDFPELTYFLTGIIPAVSQTPMSTPSPSTSSTGTPSPSTSSTRTPSPTMSSTRTPSPTTSSTGTPSPTTSLTATLSPSTSSTRTPFPTTSSTSTPTPSPTSPFLSTATSSLTLTRTSFPTTSSTTTSSPTPSSTSTRTPFPTTSFTGTSTPTKSFTSTRTTSISSTPSVTSASTGSTTPRHTPTPSLTPSSERFVNTSKAIISACGKDEPFNCVSARYKTPIRVENIDSLRQNGYRFFDNVTVAAQVLDKPLVTPSFLCGINIDGIMANPTSCSDSHTQDNGIPFYVVSSMTANSTCRGRIQNNRCRLLEYTLETFLNPNISLSDTRRNRLRLLSTEESSNYLLSSEFMINSEIVLSITQEVHFLDTAFARSFDISVYPTKFHMATKRDTHTPRLLNATTRITADSNIMVSWWFSSPLSRFFIAPPTEAVSPLVDPPRLAVKDVSLSMRVRDIPIGVTTGEFSITFARFGQVIDSVMGEVNISLSEADVRLRQSNIDASRSLTEGPTVRELTISNEGSARAKWISRLFTFPDASETPSIPWLDVPHTGYILPSQEIGFYATLSPSLTSGVGNFQAWILLETDSWNGNIQDFATEFDSLTPPHVNRTRVSFWIHVRFVVSSVFVCQQFAPVTAQVPNAINTLPLRIVNTELYAVTVTLGNFTISVLNGSKIRTVSHDQSILLRHRIGRRIVFPTPWWQISPTRLVLNRGTSGAFRIQFSYLNPVLPLWSILNDDENRVLTPGNFRMSLSASIFFGEIAGKPNDIVDTSFGVSFEPGPAHPGRSLVTQDATEGRIGERITFTIQLLDTFRYGPARAILVSEDDGISKNSDLPSLYVSINSDSSLTNSVAVMEYPPLVRINDIITALSFSLWLRNEGKLEVDSRINNVSIRGFPLVISAFSIECNGSFEISDRTGQVCVCKQGHKRDTNSQCAPCPLGTFMMEASNDMRCNLCPQDFFAEPGSSSCHMCVGDGINCRRGVIRLRQGYWCEKCAHAVSARETIVNELKKGNTKLFHQCTPAQACQVNATFFTTKCTNGYSDGSPVCDMCEDGFVKAEDGSCQQCRTKSSDIITTIAGFITAIGFIIIAAILSHRDTASFVQSTPRNQERGVLKVTNLRESIAFTLKGYENRRPSNRILMNENPLYSGEVHSSVGVKGDEMKSYSNTRSNPLSVVPGLSLRKSDSLTMGTPKTQDTKMRRNLVSVRHILLLLLDYLQLTFILHTMEISPFAENMSWMKDSSNFAAFSPSQASAFKCAVDSNPYQTSIITMATPWVVLLCVTIIQSLVACCLTRCRLPFPRKIFLTSLARTSILLMNLVHMAATQGTLQVFSVYPMEINFSKRAQLDLTMKIESTEYKLLRIIALASLIVYVLGYPLFTMVYYLRRYYRIQTEEELRKFVDLTGGFRVTGFGFLWESITVIRKIALLIIAEFVHGPVRQLTWTTTTLAVSCFVFAAIMPYKKKFVSYLQYLMVFITIMNAGMGFMAALIRERREGIRTTGEALSNFVLGAQVLLFVFALFITMTMIPKAFKAVHTLVSDKLGKCRKRTQRSVKSRNPSRKWTLVQSPLHTKRGIELSIEQRRSSRRIISQPDSVSRYNEILQSNAQRFSVIVEKTSRPRQRKGSVRSLVPATSE